MINKIGAIEPGWLLVLLLLGIALAVLLLTVRARRGRQTEGHGSDVTPLTTSQQVPYGEAEATYRAQIKKAEKDFGPEDPKLAIAIRNPAVLYYLQGKYADAEPHLRGAQGLTASQVKAAKNWKLAFYSDDFLKELGLPPDHNKTLPDKLAELENEKNATGAK